MDSSKGSRIRTLLTVFGMGIAAAFLLAMLMLYYYNPSGSYVTGNVLLSPEKIIELKFLEGNSKKGGRIGFSGMEFSYYDEGLKKRKHFIVTNEAYQMLYSLLADNQSLVKVDEEIKRIFNLGHPATLVLKTKQQTVSGQNDAQHFLQVDFIKDYYRVQLRDQVPGQNWAYFYFPGIYDKALNLLNP